MKYIMKVCCRFLLSLEFPEGKPIDIWYTGQRISRTKRWTIQTHTGPGQACLLLMAAQTFGDGKVYSDGWVLNYQKQICLSSFLRDISRNFQLPRYCETAVRRDEGLDSVSVM